MPGNEEEAAGLLDAYLERGEHEGPAGGDQSLDIPWDNHGTTGVPYDGSRRVKTGLKMACSSEASLYRSHGPRMYHI